MCDFIYLCPVCGSCFSSETSLQEHDVAVHSSKNHACLMCHNAMKDLTSLGRQVTAHKNVLHHCNICGDQRENKVDFYIHVTSSHKYGGKMACDFCLKTFSTDSNLKVHCINEHAAEMPYVLQKYESFCNVHSSHKLEDCRLDVLKDSFNPSDACALHPEEKGSRDETDNPSDVPTSNQSIFPSEAMDGTGRLHGCPGPALTELQTFYQEQGDQDWYTTSTDNLSSIIQPNDILERVQTFTENKKSQPIECSLCDMVFNNRNDYLLAHCRKDPSNLSAHKQEEKPASQVELQDLDEFRNSSTGNASQDPSKKCVREELSGNDSCIL